MFRPEVDPESSGGRAKRERSPESDRRCPWCGSAELSKHKQMPSPRGLGILAYVFFPFALMYWLGTPTYNVCAKCGGRWQRGVSIEARPREAPVRAGMYGSQVQPPAVVRKRARLGPTEDPAAAPEGDVVLRAPHGSCRVCRQASGTYAAKDAPRLPVMGCACEGGCRCEIVPLGE